MRFAFSALIALSLGLMPATTAHAEAPPDAAMACHGHGGEAPPANQAPAHDMKACAQHCLSQVNAQPNFARAFEPSLQNVVAAELISAISNAKPRMRDAPETPPPRA